MHDNTGRGGVVPYREYLSNLFALAAMDGLLSSSQHALGMDASEKNRLAESAFDLSDAMIRERDKRTAVGIMPRAKAGSEEVAALLLDLKRELNCRREHGVDGSEHLEYAEKRLAEIVGRIEGEEKP